MQTLGANAIRCEEPIGKHVLTLAYHVDATGNHDGCMQAFSDAGIYLFLDVDTFTTQIEETNPTWSYTQYSDFQAVVDAFAGYDNVAGFFVANEVQYHKIAPSHPPVYRLLLSPMEPMQHRTSKPLLAI
jgi:1,3-beta-glucanosyltransferase GAS1